MMNVNQYNFFLKLRLPVLALILISFYTNAKAQPIKDISSPNNPDTLYSISGIVLEKDDGLPLEFITVRVTDTKGTYTNRDGEFKLSLPEGRHTLSFYMPGFETQDLVFDLYRDIENVVVMLKIAEVETEELTVFAENNATRTIRMMLDYKQSTRKNLEDYTYNLYTKLIVTTDTLTAGRTDRAADTTVFSILESYSEGYYKAPDDYFNNIVQKRQSINIPPQANFINYGSNINLFDDEVRILGEDIITPFAEDSPEYYDFMLEGKVRLNDSTKLHIIQCTPKTRQRRAFSGTVYIDSARKHLHKVFLKPNRAVNLPFDAYLEIEQTFDKKDTHILPSGLRIYSTLDAEIFWIVAPRFDIRIETVAYDYVVNKGVDDDIFDGMRLELDERAEEFDSLYWAKNNVMPLRDMEIEAYEQIRRQVESPDSVEGTSFLEKALGPVANFTRRLNRPPFTGFSDIIRYNRVQGPSLGIGMGGELTPTIDYYINTGYGITDGRPFGRLDATFFTDKYKTLGLDVGLNYGFRRRDDPYVVKWRSITPLAFLSGNDYGDYYYSNSQYIGANIGFGQDLFVRRQFFRKPWLFKFGFLNEYSESANVNTAFSLFGNRDSVRNNHSVAEGNIRSVVIEGNFNYTRERLITRQGLHYRLGYSDPIWGSDFAFRKHYLESRMRFPTHPLWTADLKIGLGISEGNLPPQRFSTLESGIARIVTAGAFRNMAVKEFYGDRFATVNLEHNFGEIVPGIFRIPNIASFGLEFIALANWGYTEFTDVAIFNSGSEYLRDLTTASTADGSYYEVGLGINRLFLFFRFDIMARLSQVESPRFFINIGGATF
ncbi:MAG: hypothetical protein Kapaf2KO_00900 [Candidatus Kapaibacteriales bacterium]